MLAGDPAEKNDAFGYCLGHRSADGKHIDIDLIGRFIPDKGAGQEIDAIEVKGKLLALCHKFRPVWVDDNWGFTETRQAIKNMGIKVKQEIMDKMRYDAAKEALYQPGIVRAWLLPQLDHEIRKMELKNGRKVEFPRETGKVGHGDICDAFCSVIAELYDPNMQRGTVKIFSLPWEGK